jgi:hypothetical protein
MFEKKGKDLMRAIGGRDDYRLSASFEAQSSLSALHRTKADC